MVSRGEKRSFERQEGVGGGDQSAVVVEPRPGSAFEVIESEFPLHFLIVAFDAPSEFRQVDEAFYRFVGG